MFKGMTASTTIRKLRAENLELADVLVKLMRSAGASDDEIVAELRERFTEPAPLSKAIQSALSKSRNTAVAKSTSARRGPVGGAGVWQPTLKASDRETTDPLNPRDPTRNPAAVANAAQEAEHLENVKQARSRHGRGAQT